MLSGLVLAALLTLAASSPGRGAEATATAPALAAPSIAGVPDDAVFRALAAELGRARASLKIGESPPPYFVGARVNDIDTADVQAIFGAVTGSSERHERSLDVSIRVGDRTFDNSRFARRDPPFRFGGPEMPEEEDERELRRAIWLAIDQTCKDAVEDLARKKAVIEGQMRSPEDKLPDFTAHAPVSTIVRVETASFQRAEWEERARRLSSVLREFPEIHASSLRISWIRRIVRYLDTDGVVAMHPRTLWLLEASAQTQADDGMPLADFVSFYARGTEEAPGEPAIAAALRQMAARLTAARSAPVIEEPVSGPLLFEDQAAAEFFVALVGENAAIAREPVFEDPRMGIGMAMSGMGGASRWKGRLNSRVAADFLEAEDDPTRRDFRGTPLIGSYPVDDEGILAEPVKLVERGILTGVLATRTPVKGATRSNGHARSLSGGFSAFGGSGGSRPAPGVLIVTAVNEKPVSPQEVRERFLETLRDRGLTAGYVIRRIQNEAANPSSRDAMASMFLGMHGPRPSPVADPIEVARVSADGTESIVRGLRWGDLDVRSLKDLLLASSGDAGEAAFNLRTATGGLAGRFGGAALPTSVICPRAVLIEEAELVPASGPFPNPPVMPHPFFADRSGAPR